MTVRTARWRALAPAVALAAMLALSACGGDADGSEVASAGGDATDSATEGSTEAPDDGGMAFAECMRGEGIDMPDPSGDNGLMEAFQSVREDHTQDELRAAMVVCQDQLPAGIQGEREGQGREPLDEETQLELAECLREQGLDVPDNLMEEGLPGGVSREDLQEAMQECQDVIQ